MGSPRAQAVSFCAALAISCGASEQAAVQAASVTATSSSPEAVALYHEAELLSGHFRDAESTEKLQQAVALDPTFWLASARLSALTQGPPGLAGLQRAVAMSVRLPIAERLTIQRLLAHRVGAVETSRKLARRIADLAPQDVPAQLAHGLEELVGQHYLPAAEAYRKVARLDPSSGAAYAGLATALALGGAHEEALEAAQKYLAVSPQEPNAWDTLGEIQLAAGQLDEASASFGKAIEMQPTFWVAMQGLALARLHALDFRGARAAVERAQKTARGRAEQMKLGLLPVWAAVMEGTPRDALALAEGIEQQAEALGDPFWSAWAPIPRASVLLETGHLEEALAAVARSRSRQAALQRQADERGFSWLGLGARVQRFSQRLLALPSEVPLRISLPVLLLVVPVALSGLVLQREMGAVQVRVEQQALGALRESLRDDQRRLETLAARGEVDLIREEVAALGVDPQLELVLVARSDGAVLASNRLRLFDLPIEEALAGAHLPDPASLDAELEAARVLGEPSVRLSTARDRALGFYPLQLGVGGPGGNPASSGVLLVVRSLSRERARAVRAAVSALLPPIGLLLGLCFLVWLWFHRALSRRVQRLVEATREVAKDGGARARARLGGSDELARIGDAFDAMVDALEKSQQQARMNDRLATVGTLASGVAHEINNPLAYAIANLDFAHAAVSGKAPIEGAGRAELTAALAEAVEGARRVRGIAADLKMLSRREGDALGPVDARAVVEAALNIAGQEIRQRARVVRCYDEVPFVHGDAGRLGQVALNLLINAAQALPKGAVDRHEIRVGLSRSGDQIALDIEDTGAGIPEHVLPRIFDPFFTTKPAGEGTGLGLSICMSLVASMGGRIEVETSAGKGTRFRVWLRCDAAVSAAEAPRSQAA